MMNKAHPLGFLHSEWMWKRKTPAVLLLVLSGFIFHSSSFGATQPNVLFILTDDQGYGDLGCTGNPRIKTPNLDKLSRESIRFTDFHVSPVCAPTRAALMSGKDSNRVGVWRTCSGRSTMVAGHQTVADVFSEHGYYTFMLGKWHLGDNVPYRPQDRGFQDVLSHGGGGVGNTPDYWGNDYFDDTYFRNGTPEKFEGFCTDVFCDEALKYIESNPGKPFFGFLSLNAPHLPFVCPEKQKAMYSDLEPGLQEFYGMISNMDDNIGKLRRRLEELGIADNTLLVFMTDNGSARGAKVWNAGMKGWKGSPYEGGHRVPFFLYGKQLGPARDIDALCQGRDLMPTLLELCGIKDLPSDLDGISLVPAIQHGALPERTIILDNQQRFLVPEYLHFSTVIMRDQWRLVKGRELYDISADAGQQNDIAAVHPELVTKLLADYDLWFKDVYAERGFAAIHVGNPAEPVVCLTTHDLIGESHWNQDQIMAGEGGSGYWALNVEASGKYKISVRRYPFEANRGIRASIDVPAGCRDLTYYKDLNNTRPGLHECEYALNNPMTRALNISFVQLEVGAFTDAKPIIQTDHIPGVQEQDYTLNDRGEICAVNFYPELERGTCNLRATLGFDGGPGGLQSAYYVYIEKMK